MRREGSNQGTRSDIETFIVLAYLVACGFGINDVVVLAKGEWERN
jgi:hypothetical protein